MSRLARVATPGPDETEAITPLGLDLAEGGPADSRLQPEAIARPQATLLDDAATTRLLARLPTPAEAAQVAPDGFALREASLPRPRPGRTVGVPFPSPVDPERTVGRPGVPESGGAHDLEVARYQPEGAVEIAPGISITFSAPMVALDSVGAAIAEEPPVVLAPQPAGEWRWMDPRTLVFVPAGEHLPMATDYRVVVPAGTRSAGGAVLAADLAFAFSTPAPRLIAHHPDGGQVRPDSLVLLVFDQPVDPEAVLARTSVRAGRTTLGLRPASAEELAADAIAARMAGGVPTGRVVALRPLEPFALHAEHSVTVEAGVPSLEGPRATAEPTRWSFSTPGPFEVRGIQAGWRGRGTRPGDTWHIELSNQVDATSFEEAMVRVEPPVERLLASVSGRQVVIAAMARAKTRYQVVLDPALCDMFGQALGPSRPLRVDVGEADPQLAILGGDHVVLDPAGSPVVTVRTIGLGRISVRVHAVTPADWAAWQGSQQRRWSDEDISLPGERVGDLVLDVPDDGLALTDLDIDLTPWLRGGLGQLLLSIEPKDRMAKDARRSLSAFAWVQATRLGVDAMADTTTLRAWVTDLATGAPVGGAAVTLGTRPGATGDDGLCAIALDSTPAPVLVVRHGQDLAILPDGGWRGGWQRQGAGGQDAWLVFDDRGLYRPGEQVRLKGWLRTIAGGPQGDVGLASPAVEVVRWTARDALENEIASGEASVDRLGGFDIALDLPGTVNLGDASVELDAGGSRIWRHQVQVAEFRRPEYEVTASIGAGRAIAGEAVTASVEVAYYAGGPLRAAPVGWSVVASPARYSPPGWDRFTFGTAAPWWRHGPWADDEDEVHADLEGLTGDDGTHHLRVGTSPGSAPRPWSVSAEATVADVNRQAWTASASVLVHPSALCVGLRSERAFVTGGRPLDLEAVVVDLDGAVVAGVPIAVRAERREHRQVAGEWREVIAGTVELEAASAADAVPVALAGLAAGRWTVTVEVTDDEGRLHRSSLEVWVAGEGAGDDRQAGADELQLVPDRPAYAPGDVAEVLLLAPFTPAHGVLLVARDGVVSSEPLHVTDAFHAIRIPIEDAFTPGVHVHVVLAGSTARPDAPDGATRPAFAEGSVHLAIPPAARTLEVGIAPREPGIRPGEETVLDLVVTGADGRPVGGAGAAVIVVDEAVLAVAAYENPDPLGAFYPVRASGVETARSRPWVLLARPEALLVSGEPQAKGVRSARMASMPDDLAMPAPAPMYAMAEAMAGAMPPGAAAPPPIRSRTDFSALALFAAAVTTDADGRAAITVKVPDNLTRYRVLAVATDWRARFGVGESSLTARLPLMVRPSAPRFLTFGDTFELPVVVQNQAGEDLEVEVAVRAANATLTSGAGRRLVVPAHDRAEVRFPAAAASVGEARFEVAAAAGLDADAATVALPVWTPATTEAFALHGVLDDGALEQPVRAPAGAIEGFGGLEVTTSSTGVAALADAVTYLVTYPFECAEQLASRVLAIAALRDVLAAFGTEGQASSAELEAAVARDLEALAARQGADGGFGWWRRTEASWPYISVHVASALARARAKGFAVPDGTLAALLGYLQAIRERFPREYPAGARAVIEAYAISVRASLDDPDPSAARRLLADHGKDALAVEALAWILPVLAADGGSRRQADEVRRLLANRVVETPGAASVAVRYEDGAHLLLASDRRADAVVLEALIADQPASDLVPKLVAGLLAHRTAGRWATTQENAFVLLALGRYFDTYEAVTADFTARLWLGEDYAGEVGFRGRATDRRHLVIPMRELARGDGSAAPSSSAGNLLLAKEGPGRLYYRLGLRYAPADLRVDPLDRGFEVTRTYEGFDDPADVRRDEDGAWRIRAGARVRVTVAMGSRARRYHVALVDPLPAGLEPLDPSLATSARDAATTGSSVDVGGGPGLGGPGRGMGHWWWWRRPWFDHENLRDDRAEAFASLLWEGAYRYQYTARATTPGSFTAGPPKAEEMYAPEVFGRGASDRVIVE